MCSVSGQSKYKKSAHFSAFEVRFYKYILRKKMEYSYAPILSKLSLYTYPFSFHYSPYKVESKDPYITRARV